MLGRLVLLATIHRLIRSLPMVVAVAAQTNQMDQVLRVVQMASSTAQVVAAATQIFCGTVPRDFTVFKGTQTVELYQTELLNVEMVVLAAVAAERRRPAAVVAVLVATAQVETPRQNRAELAVPVFQVQLLELLPSTQVAVAVE
jgi:hypothetical protein